MRARHGSFLGPLAVVVYVNGLYKAFHRLTHSMFANNTNLFSTNENIADLLFLVKTNKYSLNEEKKRNTLFFTRNMKQIT